MGKPKAPATPDYAAAAKEQGTANLNSALATNYLNQPNQVTPYGNLDYSYDYQNGNTTPDGTVIPKTTVTQTLAPDQQKLLDQNNQISIALNDLAGRGIGYVDQATSSPTTANQFRPIEYATSPDQFLKQRDDTVAALMSRLQPNIDRDQAALDAKLANQGINLGSAAYGTAQNLQGQNVNDARIQALLAGNTVQNQLFNQGLASAQFNNQAQSQAIQEADYFKNQPLNMLNALRTGNSVSLPQFGNYATGTQIQAAPVYAATNDAYQAQVQAFNAKNQAYAGMMSGLGSLGNAAIGKWG